MFLKHNPPVTFGVWTSAMDAQHPLTLSRFWKRRISMLQSTASPPSRFRSWSSAAGSFLIAGLIVSLPFIHLTRDTSALADDKPATEKLAAQKPAEKEVLAPAKPIVSPTESEQANKIRVQATEIHVKGKSPAVLSLQDSEKPAEKPQPNVKRSGVFLQEVQVKGKSQAVPVTESQPVPVGTEDKIIAVPVEKTDEHGRKTLVFEPQLQRKNLTVYVGGNSPTPAMPKIESFPIPSPLDQKIIDALDVPLSAPVEFNDKSVKDCMQIICDRVKLKLHQDKKALDEESMDLNTLMVNANYEGATLRQVLESILEPHGLSYQTKAGTLQITTKAGADRRIYLYPASDLARTNDELQSLVTTLFMTPILRQQEQSKREHEQPNDDASVNVLAGTVLIRHSFQSHLEVIDLLRTLRSAAGMTQAANPRPTSLSSVPSLPQKKPPTPVTLQPGVPTIVNPMVVSSEEPSPWKTVDVLTAKPKKLMYLDAVDDQAEMLKLVKGYVRNHGRYPKDLNEFNKEVLEKAGYQLIELDPGFHYEYRKSDHLPGIVLNPKAPAVDPIAEAKKKKEDPTYLDLTLVDDSEIMRRLISNFAKRHGRYPKDLKECDSEVLEKSHYKLMKLEDGKTYDYLKDDHMIAIRRPPEKDKTESAPPADPSPVTK